MPNKAEQFAQIADQTAVRLTASWQEWAAFLTTASRLYKYPYHEQLLIYAQRPDATACAEYDLWNEKMGRYVRRGSKGIALVDDSGDRPRLRYVFDVSDTGERPHSRRPWLWTMEPEHVIPVAAMLERQYGVADPDLPQQLASVAGKLADEYWFDHGQDILYNVDGSFLEEYDEFNIAVQFKSAAAVSITYALMSRCGLEPEQYFEHEDFMAIFDFNTPATIAALGTAVSQINQQVLRQIGAVIRNAEREKLAERRAWNEQHLNLQAERGLSDPQPGTERTAGEAPGQVRQDAENLSEGASPRPLQPAAAVGEAVPAPAGDRRDGEPSSGPADAGAGAGSGRNGEPESQRPDEMGGADEQLQGPGGGADPGGAYQQLTLDLFLSEAQQIQNIDEAESRQPSAFSVSQADIDAELRQGTGYQDGKLRVYALYQHQPDPKTAVAFLKEEYGSYYGHSHTFLDGTSGSADYSGKGLKFSWDHYRESTTIKWPALEKRLRQLVAAGDYLTEQQKAQYAQLEQEYAGFGGVPMPQPRYGFPKPEAPAPTVQEVLATYKPLVRDAILADQAYQNACRNSDRENAWMEGDAAIKRAVDASGDLQLVKLYYDNPDFHDQLHSGVLEEAYPALSVPETPVPPADPQAAIDAALQEWNGDIASKQAVVRYMKDHARDKDTAAWLKQEYGDDLPAFPVPGAGMDLPWAKVQRRIAQLIREDRFYTEAERDNLDDIDPIAIREALAERGIVNGELVDPEALERDPFLQQVAADVERIAQEEAEASTPEERPQAPDLSERPVTRKGDTLTIGGGPATHEIGVTVSEEEWAQLQDTIPDSAAPVRDPLAPPYQAGDTVYLDDTAFVIERVGGLDVQLRDPSLRYPVFRAESRERFERLLQTDSRNGAITEFLPAELDLSDTDLQDVLTGEGGLLGQRDKEILSVWFATGEGNTRIAQKLSETYAGTAETMTLLSGEEADYFASTTGLEVSIQDKFGTKLGAGWQEIAPILRAMYLQERDGFFQEPPRQEPVLLEGQPSYALGDAVVLDFGDRVVSGTLGYVGDTEVRIDTGPYSWSHETMNREQFEEALRRDERNARLFQPVVKETPQPELTAEPETVYPGEKNGLPYDIVVERLHVAEPAPPAAVSAAENFRITDDQLGVGGPKAKFRANMDAIHTLQAIELEGRTATKAEQETLSRYVGWGGLADAFDPDNKAWESEFLELRTALSPAEYDSARASTLNAHYTSPTVIRAIYEAVGSMGFKAGNILEPSCGVGNFFGMLPEEMSASRLYGVELDSISGRIAKQLYPHAEITVGGFETTDRRDFYDLAVGNVPFGQYQVNDRAYNKLGFSIHNYFFAKALDQVRPGGVVAFVTSRYTMDAKDPAVRRYLAQRADLLGAIRLPNNAFRANAGTDVVSDIIFLQKRDRPLTIEPEWVHLGQNEDGFSINSYFVDHPEMILGRQTAESTQYGRQDFTVVPIEGLELSDQLHDAVKYIHGTYQEAELPDLGDGEAIDTSLPADPDVKNYSYTVVDGDVYFRENSRMVRPDLNATAEARIKGMVALRDCVHQLIDMQMDAYTPDHAIREKQAELNRLYDDFSGKYGLINDRGNRLAFSDDSSYYLLCALEVLDEDGKLERKADMFTKRTIKPHEAVTSVDTASEALAVSIAEKARVDMEYMAQLTGKPMEEIAAELSGVIFKDPAYGDDPLSGWQTADEYLSGKVRQKLREAQRAAQRGPAYLPNVEALKAAQPKDLDASEIEVRLGATWIDKEYIRQFMYETFDTPRYLRGTIDVNYAAFTAEWQITGKNSIAYNNIAAYTTYGTDRANAYRILEDSLNLRDVRIYDTIEDAEGRERRVLNAKETTLAAQKQQAIREAFKDWIWKDPERRQALVRQYNEEMNGIRPREYDGSHIVFSGMNPEITLREHQKSAIAHVLYGGNTLLAHEVGAGKTFEMVAAAMESKRLGLCQKSIFVVPNHLTEQWASEFLRLYPSANILVTTKKDFETRNRKKFCARIATGDYDAIIIGHSQFERIPISRERQERLLQEQIWEITEGIEEVQASGGERFTVKQLERTKRGLEARLEKLQAEHRKDDVVTFEQLGVDRMFVDEAHNYKNMFLYTKMRNVAGLSTSDAQKSSDMFAKCRYLDEITGSRGVVFATGTPVSNSMTELYTMQRYLQYERLREMDMVHFDCWASRFGETVTALELAPEGTGYRARTRFSKFFNLPELMNLFKEIADIKTADQLHLPTPEVEYHTVVAKPTEHQQEMVQALSERAALVHGGTVDPSVDNMLKITSDGRKLGLDQRIISPLLPDEAGTKVNQCVANILQIWRDGQADKLTQLVFCDISTPKAAPSRKVAKSAGSSLDSPEIHALETAIPLPEPEPAFTVYEDIRQKLIAQGVPPEQIAFIHEANTEVRKKELFAKVRTGQVRVLMGSTSKMGAGTNVQDRLVALHDLDCPWRPGDLAQRKGRIERQGNQNPLVHVYRYVTEGTFDAYLWQTVENKQKFISQIMTSKSPVRSCDDVDETALSFAEIKALCAGDPRIKERMDLDVEVSRLKLMKADHQSKQFRLEDNLLTYFPEQIEKNKGYIRGLETDMQTLSQHPHPEDGFAGMEIRGDTLVDKENAGAALLDACKEVKGPDPVQIGSYRGFAMYVSFRAFEKQYELTLRGEMSHTAVLGTDPRGNLTRIDNALAQMPQRLESVKAQLENLYQQQEAAKAELGRPFPYEQELRTKSARLLELDMELNMDGRGRAQPEQAIAKTSRPSVLSKLKVPPVPGAPGKPHKKEMEVR